MAVRHFSERGGDWGYFLNADNTLRTTDVYVVGYSWGSQAWAMMSGREMVLPEDVQAVAPSVMAHRLEAGGGEGQLAGRSLVRQLLGSVPVP